MPFQGVNNLSLKYKKQKQIKSIHTCYIVLFYKKKLIFKFIDINVIFFMLVLFCYTTI